MKSKSHWDKQRRGAPQSNVALAPVPDTCSVGTAGVPLLRAPFSATVHAAAIAVIGVYLTLGFALVKDYGLTMDAQDDFAIGLKYLHYYATGHLDLRDDQPTISGHPMVYSRTQIADHPYYTYPFANTLSALTCRLFYEKLDILDAVSGHHIIIPIMLAGFLYPLFLFVRRHWGDSAALLTLLFLLTYPRFFGDSFNNIKDVPLTVLFSLTIMFYADWRLAGRKLHLYLAAVFFSLAFATKPDVFFAAVILALWECFALATRTLDAGIFRQHLLLHYALAAVLCVLLSWTLYPPLHPWNPGWTTYFLDSVDYMRSIAKWTGMPWNVYAPSYVLFASPPVALLCLTVGVVFIACGILRVPLNSLLLIWVTVPVLRHCLPHTNHYDGMRHFLLFAVPFSILAALGLTRLVRLLGRCFPFKEQVLAVALGGGCIVSSLAGVVLTHPFQSTYFNALMGGLRGAQAVDYPYACDYWGNSYRMTGEWLDAHARTNANYHAIVGAGLQRWSIRRPDLVEIPHVNSPADIPPNTYLIVIPRKRWGGLVVQWGVVNKWKYVAATYQRVYHVERQGGEIVSIFYNP